MLKKFLTLRTLRRSLVELSRSPNINFEHVTEQLEKTRNELLFMSGCDELQKELADLQKQIKVSRVILNELDAKLANLENEKPC